MEHGRYDLAFEIGDRILRVRCRWGALPDRGAIVEVDRTSNWCTAAGYERRYYSADEVDLVAIYCSALEHCTSSRSRSLPGGAASSWG